MMNLLDNGAAVVTFNGTRRVIMPGCTNPLEAPCPFCGGAVKHDVAQTHPENTPKNISTNINGVPTALFTCACGRMAVQIRADRVTVENGHTVVKVGDHRADDCPACTDPESYRPEFYIVRDGRWVRETV